MAMDMRFGLDTGQVILAKHILEKAGEPLSWISFTKEFEKHQTVESYQELQDAFRHSSDPELLSSRGFISLNNPRNTALLKFALILIATKHSNISKLQFCKVSHYFFLTSSKEEKDQLGNNHDLLLNAAAKFPNVFFVDMDEREIRLKPTVAEQHADFFKLESESETSAIHKLKYFLFICNGKTSLNSAFEFCRCILNKQEKTHLGRNTAVEFNRALESLRTSIYTEGSVITLSPPINGPRGETPEEVCSTPPANGNSVASTPESRIKRVEDLLEEIESPITWTDLEDAFSSVEGSDTWDKDLIVKDILDIDRNRFIFSEEFISLKTSHFQGFLKLCLIVRMSNVFTGRCGLYDLYKTSKLTLDIKEKGPFAGDLQSFLKSYPKFFEVVGNPGGTSLKGRVDPGESMFKFEDFFQCRKHDQTPCPSCQLLFFMNISGGRSQTERAFQFMKLITSYKALQSKDQEMTLEEFNLLLAQCERVLSSNSYGIKSRSATPISDRQIHQLIRNSVTSTPGSRIETVKDLLEEIESPISWTDLEDAFSSVDGRGTCDRDLIVEDILNIDRNRFIFSEEFISLKTPRFQGFLKLCSIVRMSEVFTGRCELYDLYKTSKLTLDIKERDSFKGDIQSFLKSYPEFFELVGNPGGMSLRGSVSPGESMFNFEDFFQCRKHEQTFCPSCQLVFFINISGGRSLTERAFQFMKLITSYDTLQSEDRGMTLEEFSLLLEECKSVLSSNSYEIKSRSTTPSTDRQEHQLNRTADRQYTGNNRRPITLGWFIVPENNGKREKTSQVSVPASPCTETIVELPDSAASVSEDDYSSSNSSDDEIGEYLLGRLNGNNKGRSTEGIVPVLPYTQVLLDLPDCAASVSKDDYSPSNSSDNDTDGRLVNAPSSRNQDNRALPFTSILLVNKYEHLKAKISEIQTSEQPVVYLAHDKETVVVLDHSTTGCMFQISQSGVGQDDDGKNPSEFWTLLWEFFQDTEITFVTLDCEDVARMLRDRLGLHLNNVYDMKIALGMISFSNESQFEGLSIFDVCKAVGLSGPDTVSVTIDSNGVGDMRGSEAKLAEAVQNAAALSLGLHSWTLQRLEDLGAVEKHRKLTNDKLRSVYMELSGNNLPVMSQYPDMADKPMLSGEFGITPSWSLVQSAYVKSGSAAPSMSTVQPFNSVHGMSHASSIPSLVSSTDKLSPVDTDPFADSLRAIYSRCTSSTSSSRSSALNARSVPSNPSSGYPTEASDQEVVSSSSATRNENHPESVVQGSKVPPSHSIPQGVMPKFIHMSDYDEAASLPQKETDDIQFVGDSEDQNKRGHGTLCLCKDENAILSVPKAESSNYDSNLSGLTEDLLRQYSERNRESIEQLLRILGEDIATTLMNYLQKHNNMFSLTEIILDVGRRAEARFHKDSKMDKQVVIAASINPVSSNDMRMITNNDSLTGFDEDNRCGIEGSLHSIRGLRNKKQKLIGLTIRIGLPLLGCADMMYDIAQEGKSALIAGHSGVGKTTLLRELARCLSDNEKKRVLVIDTHNEIAGDYDTSHFSIGSARRQQVDSPENQYRIVRESVRNHCPEVVIMDLIDSAEESGAVAKLIERGIQVFAGVSKDSARSVCNSPNCIQIFQVTGVTGEDMNSLDSAGELAECKPSFEALVEMRESRCWNIHDLSYTYNSIKRNKPYSVQERRCISLTNKGVFLQQILLREKVIE